jgi:hypothetical protein
MADAQTPHVTGESIPSGMCMSVGSFDHDPGKATKELARAIILRFPPFVIRPFEKKARLPCHRA